MKNTVVSCLRVFRAFQDQPLDYQFIVLSRARLYERSPNGPDHSSVLGRSVKTWSSGLSPKDLDLVGLCGSSSSDNSCDSSHYTSLGNPELISLLWLLMPGCVWPAWRSRMGQDHSQRFSTGSLTEDVFWFPCNNFLHKDLEGLNMPSYASFHTHTYNSRFLFFVFPSLWNYLKPAILSLGIQLGFTFTFQLLL